MKYLTVELEGAQLDAAVALALGLKYRWDIAAWDWPANEPYRDQVWWPSQNSRHGERLIQSEGITVSEPEAVGSSVVYRAALRGFTATGDRRLIAAMRVLALSRHGEFVQLSPAIYRA